MPPGPFGGGAAPAARRAMNYLAGAEKLPAPKEGRQLVSDFNAGDGLLEKLACLPIQLRLSSIF
jgi:hypothetical protein